MADAVDIEKLARDWLATQGQKTLVGTAGRWLKGRAIDLLTPIGKTVRGAREDGWTIGRHAAADVAGKPDRFDWKRWIPGRATPLSEQGAALRALLKDADVTISSVAANRFDMLARILADSIGRGDTVDELTEAIRPVLRNPEWARTVAITETVRAINASARERYAELGIKKLMWQTAADEHTCPVCLANEAAGAVNIDDRFPSGDAGPPAHPNCLCRLTTA